MSEPWFNAAYYAWIPGTLLGCLGGLWGSLVGMLAPRGKAKAFVLGFGMVLLLASVVLLVAGLVALASGQPYGVWYGLGLAGLLGSGVLGPLLPQAVRRYREAEERRMRAQDFS